MVDTSYPAEPAQRGDVATPLLVDPDDFLVGQRTGVNDDIAKTDLHSRGGQLGISLRLPLAADVIQGIFGRNRGAAGPLRLELFQCPPSSPCVIRALPRRQ